MKKIFMIQMALCLILSAAQAQTKKNTKAKAPVKKTTTVKTTTKAPEKVPAKKEVLAENKQETIAMPTAKPKSAGQAPDYKTAIGVKFLYGIGVTVKHFFTEKHALEGIFRYRSFSGLGSDIDLTALYEYHGKFNGLPELKWYGGGGIYAGNFSLDNDFGYVGDQSFFYAGVAAVLGLEYKFKNTPLAISADWQPVYVVKDSYNMSGFGADNGGFGLKYTF